MRSHQGNPCQKQLLPTDNICMPLPSPSYQMGAYPSSLWDILSSWDVPFYQTHTQHLPHHAPASWQLRWGCTTSGSFQPHSTDTAHARSHSQPQAACAGTKQAQAAARHWCVAGHYWGERGWQHGKLCRRSHLEEGALPRNSHYSRLTVIRNTEEMFGKNTGSAKAPWPLPTCSISSFRGIKERFSPK